jgi:putative membrane protein
MLKLTDDPQSFEEPQAKRPLDFGQVSVHLSNERTFLAWTWTGMLLMGFGVAIAKMRIAISDFSQTTGAASQSTGAREISPITMGLSFLVVGLVTILLSAIRYLTVQNQLRKHTYQPSNLLFFIFLTALAVLSGTLIIHVWQLRQTLG